MTWDPTVAGVLSLPSGRLVRGRGLRRGQPVGPVPEFGVYLLGRRPQVGWEHQWIRWPDFWLPTDRVHAARVLTEAWQRAATQRVEIACGGGRGRTGTALACLAVLDGLTAGDAVAFVRAHYHRHAVETPWQKRYVGTFRGSATIDDVPHR
jgi:protein-tyrosine phosphatase